MIPAAGLDGETSLAIGLIDPTPDQIHDGLALASYLRERAIPSQVLRFAVHDRRRTPAEAMVSTGAPMFFLAAGRDNITQALGVGWLLRRSGAVYLFGREMSDPRLREAVSPDQADGVIVGDPYAAAWRLSRAEQPAPAGRADAPGGLYRPGDRSLVPRSPLRDLDRIPAGDYSAHPRQAALGIPLHTSRSHPHPCLFVARRAWELPSRRRSTDKILEDMARHVQDDGARHFIFTDLVINTDSDALLDLCRGMIERGLLITWQGRIWPDDRLDRSAFHLLGRSGCRDLSVDFFTGSDRLSRQLRTGVEASTVARLLRLCRLEGIRTRISLIPGLPGERPDDRAATLSWLRQSRDAIYEVSDVRPPAIRSGAPIRQQDLHFPADGSSTDWHDGADNNQSQREVWRRELVTWIDHLGIWRQGPTAPGFSREMTGKVLRRLTAQVERARAEEPGPSFDRLQLAGLVQGRETLCGPSSVELDLVGMSAADAIRALEGMAALGTRAVSLGRPPQEGDVILYPHLEEILARARTLGMDISLATTLSGASADHLRIVGGQVQELVVHGLEDAWPRIERWIPVVAVARADRRSRLPLITVRARLSRQGPALSWIISRAAEVGVDRIFIELARSDDAAVSGEQREEAMRWLQEVRDGAYRGGGADGAPGEDLLLPAGASWPVGFELKPVEAAGWRCSCPGGQAARRIAKHHHDPTGRLAFFDREGCAACDLLRHCPVSRVDFSVRLGFLQVSASGELLDNLSHEDCGRGHVTAVVERRPCLVGWDAARIDPRGDLYLCPEGGLEPVGNVLNAPVAGLWYGRQANEFRRMARGAAKVLPLVNRSQCFEHCRRFHRNGELMQRLDRLTDAQRKALAKLGSDERLGR